MLGCSAVSLLTLLRMIFTSLGDTIFCYGVETACDQGFTRPHWVHSRTEDAKTPAGTDIDRPDGIARAARQNEPHVFISTG